MLTSPFQTLSTDPTIFFADNEAANTNPKKNKRNWDAADVDSFDEPIAKRLRSASLPKTSPPPNSPSGYKNALKFQPLKSALKRFPTPPDARKTVKFLEKLVTETHIHHNWIPKDQRKWWTDQDPNCPEGSPSILSASEVALLDRRHHYAWLQQERLNLEGGIIQLMDTLVLFKGRLFLRGEYATRWEMYGRHVGRAHRGLVKEMDAVFGEKARREGLME